MFDPRVILRNDVDPNAIRRIWCAENVGIAYDAYEQGMPLVDKPFVTGMPHVRKPGLRYDWSDNELLEAIKCKNDIRYFARKCQLLMPDQTYAVPNYYDFQDDVFEAYQNNRYLLWLAARQSSKTTTISICLLHSLIFGENEKIYTLGDKLGTSVENVTKIKAIYERLPFYLKPGCHVYNQGAVVFDNGNGLFSGVCNHGSVVGKTISRLHIDEFSIPDDNQIRAFYEFAMPTISRLQNSKLIITSSMRLRDHLFNELVQKARAAQGDKRKSPFHFIETKWNDIPGRGQTWKDEQIGILGSERAFDIQFGNQPIAGGSEWLTPEASEYMDELILEANYDFARNLTDREDVLSKLAKVEPVILKSKYVNKSTLTPKTRLVDMLQINTAVIDSLEKLKDLPLVITIDSGEGRGGDADYTVVNFGIPEFADDKRQVIEDSMAELEAESMALAQKQQYVDEDDDEFASMVEDEVDEESLDADFMLANSVRVRQVGILYSNEHCMPMIALFLQIFLKSFCNMDKVRIVCELDGLGSLMQQYLQMDIVKNSSIDLENFGTCAEKGKPGIYMRGKNKVKYIDQTESIINDNRILCNFGATVYEVRKFNEVKPGKWEGVSAHDDHTMTVVMLGGYMSSINFIQFIEDLIDSGPTDDEDYAGY